MPKPGDLRVRRRSVHVRRRPSAVPAPAVLPVLLICLAGVACRPDAERVVYRLAELLPDAPSRSASVSLLPGGAGQAGRLTEGWSAVSPDVSGERWALGLATHATFTSFVPLDTAVVFEARPYAPQGAPQQTVEVVLNDVSLGTVDLEPRWSEYRLPVPADSLRRGENRLALLFDHAIRPADAEGGDDTRRLAARFRRLAVGNALADAMPEVAKLETVADAAGAMRVEVAMPAGSWRRVWLQLPRSARLAGRIGVAADAGAAALAVVDLEDEAGAVDRLVESRIEVRQHRELDVDLSDWAGQVVSLWIGSDAEGTDPGRSATVRWREPVILAPEAPIAALAEPAGPVAPRTPSLGRPDIYVIILDAARADAFTPYGAARPTPAVQALAEDGTVFARAYTAAPWTGQAVPSLFTGRYPEAHGVETWGWALSDSIPTLAEIVGQAGYHTVLWTQHAMYAGNRTLRRGFDEYVEAPRDEPGVVPDGEALFLEGYPTFAVLHWLPPHEPYAPPAPFRGRYSSWQREPLAANAQFLNRFPLQLGPDDLTEDHLRYVRDRYDENVLYADDIVGRFVATLRRAGRYDDALVILLADHGEGFFEHGYFLHTRYLYDEVLRVPFVIKWPAGVSGGRVRVEEPVSTIQLLPSIVDALGLERPALHLQADSLLPVALDGARAPSAVYFSSRGVAPPEKAPRPLWGLRAGPLKVIWDDARKTLEVYDLDKDPAETENLAPAMPQMAAFLRQQADLQRRRNRLLLLSEAPAGQAQELDPETIEKLRALGYVQ